MNELGFFVDLEGRYLGQMDVALAPSRAVQVPSSPADARQVWSGTAWGAIQVSPAERAEQLAELLAGIDAASARPLRAIVAGVATDADRDRLAELEDQASTLRAELAALGHAVS